MMKKRILAFGMVIALVLSTVMVSFAADEYVLITDGDFDNYELGKFPQMQSVADWENALKEDEGVWLHTLNDSFGIDTGQGVSVGYEDENLAGTDPTNKVLIFDKPHRHWDTFADYMLPVKEIATGIYKLKFRVKLADAVDNNDKVKITLTPIVLRKTDKNITPGPSALKAEFGLRSEALGATQTYSLEREISGPGWQDVEFEYDAWFRHGDGTWVDWTNVAGMGFRIKAREDFNKNDSEMTDEFWAQTDIVYFDDFQMVAPEKMVADPEMSHSADAFPVDGGYVTVNFNYDNLYSSTINADNVYLERQDGEIVDTQKVSIMSNNRITGFKVKMNNLDHNTGYTLRVKDIVSQTPVANWDNLAEYFQNTLNNYEKRYIRQYDVAEIPFRTVEHVTVGTPSYDSVEDDITTSITVNNDREAEDVYALAYKKADGAVSSPVTYKKVSIDNTVPSITLEDVDLAASEGNAGFTITKSLGETVDEELKSQATTDVSASKQYSNITAKGTLTSPYYGKKAEIYILLPNDDTTAKTLDISGALEGGKLEDTFFAIDEVQIEDDGDFTYTSPTCNKSGYYKIIVKVDNKVFIAVERYISSPEDNEAFLEKINDVISTEEGPKTEAQMEAELLDILETEDVEQAIRYESAYYRMLGDSSNKKSKKLLTKNILENIPYATLDDFEADFLKQTALLAIIRTADDAELKAAIAKTNKTFGELNDGYIASILEFANLSSTTAYDVYDEMSSTDKLAVCEAISEKAPKTDIRTAAAFKDLFDVEVLNKQITDTVMQSEIGVILNGHTELLDGLSFSKYNKLGLNKSKVNEAIKNHGAFDSIADLIKKANKYIKNANAGGGGGGGGGGDTGSGSKDDSEKYFVAGTITPNVGSVPAPAEYFDDIDQVDWAKDAINTLVERRVVSGKGNNKFAPMDNVTREEFVKMLVLAAKLEYKTPSDLKFDDVDDSAWYSQYVYIARQLGIVNGINETTFGVGQNITRQDLFVMCANILYEGETADASSVNRFDDVADISDYAVGKIELLVNDGIVSGSDGKINPKSNATRAEAAKIIYGLLSKLDK